MRTQTLGVVSLSTLSLLTGSVLAKVQSRSGRHGHLKYKGFAYPPRANVQDLKDNQVDHGYEIHEGKLVRSLYSIPATGWSIADFEIVGERQVSCVQEHPLC